MSTKKKAGPKWPGTMDPIPIKKEGVYELRSEKRLGITKGSDNRWIDDSNETTRKFFWRSNGVHSTGNTDFDVMAFINPIDEPKPEPPKPVITGPGEYIADNGSKVVIEFRSSMGTSFPWVGYVHSGNPVARMWDSDGKSGTHPALNIIGPWVEDKKFLVPCINFNDGQLEVVCLSAANAKEASEWVHDNHPEYHVGNAMTADEMTKYIAAAIRPAIEGVEK